MHRAILLKGFLGLFNCRACFYSKVAMTTGFVGAPLTTADNGKLELKAISN